jgi:hypothetical protein
MLVGIFAREPFCTLFFKPLAEVFFIQQLFCTILSWFVEVASLARLVTFLANMDTSLAESTVSLAK